MNDEHSMAAQQWAAYVKEDRESEALQPYVIDADSSFIDFWGDRHEDACGWLAVYAALLFDKHTGELTTYIKNMWDTISITQLKLWSGHLSRTGRILDNGDGGFDGICKALLMRIREFSPLTPNSPKIYGDSTYQHTIDLWLAAGHYTAYLTPDKGVGYRETFAKQYGHAFNLTCGQYKRRTTDKELADNEAAAIKLSVGPLPGDRVTSKQGTDMGFQPGDYVMTDAELKAIAAVLAIWYYGSNHNKL